MLTNDLSFETDPACPTVVVVVIIIIIITLFQEDSIFGMNASLTYGPQYTILQLQYSRLTHTYKRWLLLRNGLNRAYCNVSARFKHDIFDVH